ncbi:MAG: tripartite tricarboxylate transporter TctB family protein [Rhodospirillaceae bacterium]|jgi:hypothetical protein
MAELPNTDGPKKKSTGADLIIPVAAIAFTLYYFSTIWNSPWSAQVSAFFVGGVLMVLCAIYFVIFAMQRKNGEADFSLGKVINPVSVIPKRILLFVLTLAYIFVIDWFGFIITTFTFLSLGMLLLSEGKNKKLILSLSATLAIGGYLLFVVAFQRRFPDGPIEKWLKPFWYSTGIWQ